MLRAAGWVGLLTLASRVLGLLRDMVIAALFHKTITDAFFVAFTIPNVLRRLLAEGSLTVAFIPIFTEYRERHGLEESRRMFHATWTTMLLLLLGVCVVGVLASPGLVRLFAWGFADEPAKFDLAVRLTQIMFPYIFFVSLLALCMGVLNTTGHFTAPAVAPVLLNIAMIGATLALWRPLTNLGVHPIYGLAAGVIAGGLVQLLLQYPPLISRGYRPRLRFEPRHPGVTRTLKLMAPAIFGLALYQINVILARLLASFLPDGTVTYLYYAQRLIEFPMGIFAVAVATAAMPRLSRHATAGELSEVRTVFADSLRLTNFIVIPAMVGLLAIGEPIIAVLFERGRFTPEMTVLTGEALAGFCLGLWAAAGVRLAVPVFYALEDSRTPVKVAGLALLVYIGVGLALMWPLKHLGLALAISASTIVNFTLLMIFLRRRLGRLGLRAVLSSAVRSLVAAGLMGAAAWAVCQLPRWLPALAGFGRGWGRLALLAVALTVAGVVYFGTAAALRCPEPGELAAALRRRTAGQAPADRKDDE